jgi:hypothetical protein
MYQASYWPQGSPAAKMRLLLRSLVPSVVEDYVR